MIPASTTLITARCITTTIIMATLTTTIMTIPMIIFIVMSGFVMMGNVSGMNRGAAICYQAAYWASLLGGLAILAWGVLAPTSDGVLVTVGVGFMLASILWGFWGNRLF